MYGAYFKRSRERARLSPVEMAKTIGYASADSIYRIERDANDITWEQADKWAAACGKLIGDILPNSGSSDLDVVFQPLIVAMAGMTDDEMRDEVLNLASQARLVRNAITRRETLHVVEGQTSGRVATYNPQPSEKVDRPRPVGDVANPPKFAPGVVALAHLHVRL